MSQVKMPAHAAVGTAMTRMYPPRLCQRSVFERRPAAKIAKPITKMAMIGCRTTGLTTTPKVRNECEMEYSAIAPPTTNAIADETATGTSDKGFDAARPIRKFCENCSFT